MARILVQHNKKFRLWCDTADLWVTPLMNGRDMIEYLVNKHFEPHTYEEAIDRIKRKGYDKKHLEWLDKWFDSNYEHLCLTSKNNGGD